TDKIIPEKIENGFIKKVILLESTVSTNDVCKSLAFDGEIEGTLVIADEQTGGRGRMGRVWSSPKGEGIWMSLILRQNINPYHVSSVTLLAGLAVCRALRSFGIDAVIKWPNDVWINGKKVCGILTEMSASQDGIDFVIVGIGVNVNTSIFPQELENIACSLYTETNKKYERNTVIAEIWHQFGLYYDGFAERGFSAIKNEYEKYCTNIGKRVNVLCDDGYEALAMGIDDSGSLVVLKDNGEKTAVFSGEVSIRNI
ncbi:MAG: biotin--[Firmicutes bacterium]|nr:biotin--[acetyl-CoA-carboxylase] ligase [Bacillota bacterium]